MAVHAPSLTPPVNRRYVDAAYVGVSTGSQLQPYTTIQEGIDDLGAGDEVLVAPGTYDEDLVWAAGEDINLLGLGGLVQIQGAMVITDASVTLANLNIADDGVAGTDAIHFTGTGADTLRLMNCDVQATAAGLAAISADNTAGTVTGLDSTIGSDVANANQALQLESGSLDFRNCDIIHGSNVAEAFVAEGDAASAAILFKDCRFVGSVNAEAAVAAPTSFVCEDCTFTVGAVAAINTAATCTIQLKDPIITSTEAAQDAVLGAGTLLVLGEANFLGTANEIACTASSHAVNSKHQSGTVAAAGASPQIDAVVFAEVLPTTDYVPELTFEATGGGADDVICSVDQGTIAVTGFSVVTTSASGAAISGDVNWTVDVE